MKEIHVSQNATFLVNVPYRICFQNKCVSKNFLISSDWTCLLLERLGSELGILHEDQCFDPDVVIQDLSSEFQPVE